MDPFTMAIVGGIGLGLQGAGLFGGMSASGKYNQAQQQQIQAEQAAEAQRRQLDLLKHQRNQVEIYRNAQRAKSLALNNSVNQGANFGSGLSGGLGQISGQSGTNLVGENQNFQIGQNIFDDNAKVSNAKIAQANAQQDMQKWQGLSSFGGSLIGSATSFGKLSSQTYAGNQSSPINQQYPQYANANNYAYWS